MTNTKLVKIFAFVLLLNLTIPIFIFSNNILSNSVTIGLSEDLSSLKTQSFSKDDYTAILTSKEQGLGNISINDMTFDELEMGFHLYNEKYPDLPDDYINDYLNMTLISMDFIDTINPAISDNINPNIIDRDIITVRLNETLNISYNSDPGLEGYLIYRSRLTPCRLLELHVNVSSVITKIDAVNYSIDENDFLFFNYENYFDTIPDSFMLHITWEYDLTLGDWELDQDNEVIKMTEQEQTLEAGFNYQFKLHGEKFQNTIEPDPTEYAEEIRANLTVNLPDKNLLEDHSLIIDGEEVVSSYLDGNNSIYTGFIGGNETFVNITFTADFTLKFIDPVEESWAIDRLLSNRINRERIYFPTVVDGPVHIYIENVKIFEESISYTQYIGESALYVERTSTIKIESGNVSHWEDNPELFTTNEEESLGLNITLPYIIKNEVCPFSIDYRATEDLKIKITDNIGMPLIGIQVEFTYYGKPYGTYISKDSVQPIFTQTTDSNAEILLENVPNGNYEISLYILGNYQCSFTVSTYNEINEFASSIFHFPFWILIFGLFNISIIALGSKLYLNNKKRQ